MRNWILLSVALMVLATSNLLLAQQPQVVELNQTEGKFTKETLKLQPGSYVFEVTNVGVDRALGFVLAPKGKPQQEFHIQEAYLEKTIGKGEKARSKVVELAKGEYEYFCPLNPTPMYVLIVK